MEAEEEAALVRPLEVAMEFTRFWGGAGEKDELVERDERRRGRKGTNVELPSVVSDRASFLVV